MTQLICLYGEAQEAPNTGRVVEAKRDTDTVDMSAYPGMVLLPYDGPLESLARLGPEPELLGDPPTKRYPSAKELDAEGVPADHPLRAKAGQLYEDNRRLAMDLRPYAAPEITPDILTAYAAQTRYAKEIAGITVGKIPVSTDRDSQAAIQALASRAARDPKYAPPFKSQGAVYTVTNGQMIAIGDAVGDYGDACVAAEGAVLTGIKAGKTKTLGDIDAAFSKIGSTF